uniref:Activating transcription factor 6 beta n=1 Tax=Anisakis simplex TaxID=6269 RepID=A0A0M3JDP4_ANISI
LLRNARPLEERQQQRLARNETISGLSHHQPPRRQNRPNWRPVPPSGSARAPATAPRLTPAGFETRPRADPPAAAQIPGNPRTAAGPVAAAAQAIVWAPSTIWTPPVIWRRPPGVWRQQTQNQQCPQHEQQQLLLGALVWPHWAPPSGSPPGPPRVQAPGSLEAELRWMNLHDSNNLRRSSR